MTVAPNDAVAQGLWGKQGAAANPQELNRYSYVNNNPVNATDPTGHFLDTLADIAFIAYDIYDISQNGLSWESGLALGADVVGAVVPFASGGGVAVRAVMHADDAVAAVKVATKGTDGVKAADNIPCALNSFSADTLVATKDGYIPISELAEGDVVLAYNEVTGETSTYTITATIAHVDLAIVKLTIDGEQLTTTREHPFYVLGRGWVNAGSLHLGDAVPQLDGTTGMVQRLRTVARPQVMYNLSVDTAHTFFVGQGAWLVHNCGGFSSGKPPHVAEVTVTRNGEEVYSGVFKSGNMTPEEAALGFPRSSLATHTEARAVRQVSLQAGDSMLIKGQYPPCPSCKGAMNKAARSSNADIKYTWNDNEWDARRK